MNIPLVSEYKVPFIFHRILQTFFGGFELSSSVSTPTTGDYSYSFLIRLFIYCFPSVVGIVFTMLIDNRLVDSYIGVLTASIIGFIFTFTIHLLSRIQPEMYKTSPLVFSAEASTGVGTSKPQNLLQKLIPASKYNSKALVLGNCFMTSSLLGIMTHTFKLRQIRLSMHTGNFLTLCIFGLVWFTLAITHHSLTMGPPPETAAYSMTFNKMDCFNRPTHLLILAVLVALGPWPTTYLFCTILICALPFLWLLGIIPPLLALYYYLLEQFSVIVLGGTATCSILSLTLSVLFSIASVFTFHFYLDSDQFLLATSLVAFLVSNKWLSNWHQLRSCFYLLKTLFCLGAIVAIEFFRLTPGSNVQWQLFITLLASLALVCLVHYSEIVYIANKIKNPLSVLMSSRLLKRVHSNSITVGSIRVVLHLGMPLLGFTLVLNQMAQEGAQNRTGHLVPQYIGLNLLVFRVLRQVWHEPFLVGCQIVVLHLTHLYWPTAFFSTWPIEARHFLLTISFHLSTDIAHKLYLVISLLLSSVMIKKQRFGFSWILFALNVLLFPANLAIILVSSLLNAPILPLFTLPIYLLSFPRPLKFWATTPTDINNNSQDAVYYQQILPRFVQSLHDQGLFWDFCKSGEFFLARFDDRLMWLQVLESGHNYVQVQMKGLELQETSCHAIEASAIDHMIEVAFQSSRASCTTFLNRYFYYTITPMMKASVKTYSDAKNILTGIIDSPETYARIKALFCQVFIWVLLQTRLTSIYEKRKFDQRGEVREIKEVVSSVPVEVESSEMSRSDERSSPPPPTSPTSPISPTPLGVGLVSYEELQPSLQWSNASYQYSKSKPINPMANYLIYSTDWFQEVLKVQTKDQCQLNENELQSLTVTYRHITNVCFSVMFPTTYSEVPTAQSICDVFNGDIIRDNVEKKLFEHNLDLYQACVKGFQYTTKIAFDQMIFSNEDLLADELVTILQDFDHNWFFGSRNTPGWKDAVIEEKMYLFSINKDLVKENYKSHLLTLQDTEVYVCSLNRAMIEAIWSSLSFELFYLTNDDEERYSIQAHSIILRNLTVQAADSPLGYPVFASKPILINHIS